MSGAILVLLNFCAVGSAAAQNSQDRSGVARILNWPDDSERSKLHHEILPFIDTLTVAYSYRIENGSPILALRLDWIADDEVIFRGRRMPASEVGGDIFIAALDLRGDVLVDGRRVGGLIVEVDSMRLDPVPDYVDVELPDLTWDNVFTDLSGDEARDVFERGFELVDFEIATAAFSVAFRDSTQYRPWLGRSEPWPTTIYRHPDFVDVFVDVSWLTGRSWYDPPESNDGPRKAMGRGGLDDNPRSRAGRSAAGRGKRDPDSDRGGRDSGVDVDESTEHDGSRDGRRGDPSERGDGDRKDGGFTFPGSDGDDDDDDDESLVPYAIAAAGAAGILAAVGGTVGYYGNADFAPIGLTSGLVRRDGGILLQVAVNEALLAGGEGPRHLLAKVLSFGNLLDAPIQPALGAGVLATSRDGEEIDLRPSLSLGAVTTQSALMLYAGYDIWQNGPEFSVALNIHRLLRGRSR